MIGKLKFLLPMFALSVLGWASEAASAEGLSQPWQVTLQDAASPVMEEIHDFHALLMVVMVGIVLLVLAIVAYVCFRFRANRHPVPSKTTHNTLLEVVWTAVPIVILVIIAIPGMRLLYYSDRVQDYELTLKVVGHQWYWTYAYPDQGDFEFDSIMIPESDLQPGQPRLLAVDNEVVLPVDTDVQVLVTADDVIHNWAIPSLGMKVDAVPGRVNERWVRINEEGTYYGMCSELCGVNHGFMPIKVRAVSKEAFAEWVEKAKEEFARADRPGVNLVEADSKSR